MGKINKQHNSSFLLLLLAAAVLSHAQVLVRDIPAPSSSTTSITYDGTDFWTGDNNSNRLIKISLANGALLDTVFSPVNGSDGLAFDGEFLWTISGAASRQRIYKLDPQSGALLDSIPDPAQSNAGGLSAVGQEFWMGRNFPANRFYHISNTGTLLDSLAAPGNQIRGVAYDNGMIWATSVNADADVIYWVNASTGAVQWQFDLPEHASLPDRRLRGVVVVNGYLWIVAYDQATTANRILQYDISNAVTPDIDVVEISYDFGEMVVGHPLEWNLLGSNIGNVPLSIEGVSFTANEAFSASSPTEFPVVVAPESEFAITVVFDPVGQGQWNDTIWIASNDPDEPVVSVALEGFAHADEGDIEWSPTALDFGEVWYPNPTASSSRALQIENIGHGSLTIETIEITGGIYYNVETPPLPMTLDSMSSINISVWFNPTAAGTFNGALTIRADDPDEPEVTVLLTGVGVLADFEAGDAMWTYRDASDDFDVGINALEWIGDVNGDGAADAIVASGSGLNVCVSGASSGPADTLWAYDSRSNPNHSGPVYYERALDVIEDITGDGIQDVLIGTAGNSKSVYALSGATGEELWMFDSRWWGEGGWINDVEGFVDINNDFVPDVLAAGNGEGADGARRVFALNGQSGELLWEGPALTSFYSMTAIEDVTGDGIADVVGGRSGWVVGINGATGEQRFQTSISNGSPVFDLERMGNANPQTNTSEDVAVASAYQGVYVIDGLTGAQLWLQPFTSTFVYEVTVLPDITGDDVSEVVVGTVSGRVVCYDGAGGIELWNVIADPTDPGNVLTLGTIPDISGDNVNDIVCGTLSNRLIVLSGWDGDQLVSTFGAGTFSAVDAVGYLPDVDGSNACELLLGNREGFVDCISGGTIQSGAKETTELPQTFELHPAYPNPFNPVTTVRYSLATASDVRLRVYSVTGRLVRDLVNARQSAGDYEVTWNATDQGGQMVSTGVYFISLSTPQLTRAQKVLLLK